MANEKIIAANGVSDEDVAHIRLLMRKAADQLTHAWRWGADAQADLLIVNPSDFAGQMARSRAKVTGMRVAIVCDADAEHDGDPALVRPFRPDNVVAVLNNATATAVGLTAQSRAGTGYVHSSADEFQPNDDFPDLDVLDDSAQRRMPDPDVAIGLDELIRDNPLADPYLNLKPDKLSDTARIEGAGDPTRRSALRADRDRESQAVPLNAPTAERVPARKQNIEDLSVYRLREILEGGLIAGPVQIAWAGEGALSLDPKNKVFHSQSSLRELECYCRKSSRLSDWRRLTSAEMATIRETQPAQTFERLIWLDVLLHSNGQLAAHLHPGGTFELSRWLEIARDYPAQARISAAMMRPSRMHEIAATSECQMSMVFDVVNAYDAIGWLKWTPRKSRHDEEDAAQKKPSLLSRLRNPFGKS